MFYSTILFLVDGGSYQELLFYSLPLFAWSILLDGWAGNNSRRRSQVHAIHSTRRKGKWPAFLLIAALVNFLRRVREKVNTFSVSHIRGWMNREAAHFSQQQRHERTKEAEGYMSLCPLLRLCLLAGWLTYLLTQQYRNRWVAIERIFRVLCKCARQ